MKISAGIANREDMLDNADQMEKETEEMEREVRSVLSKLRDLKSFINTTFYDQLQDVMTFRKEKNAQGLASLKKELNEALRKHLEYKKK